MKGKEIKNLLIDLGGVLIDLDHERCIGNFKRIGFQNIEEGFCTRQPDGIFLQQKKGLVTPAEFRDGIREVMGEMISDKQIDAAWDSFLIDIPAYKLDLLLELCKKCIVYLFSNTNDIHRKQVCKNAFPYRVFKVKDYFEKTYLSYEMKMAKPESEIFRAVTEDAGTDPRETFFIDDSEIDCKVAQELGISTYTPKAGED